MPIARFLERLDQRRLLIGVVGDGMIDRYVPVIADRLSPEFPIPITRRDHARPVVELPGGAANVAHQFRNFKVDHHLVTAVDPSSETVYDAADLRFRDYSIPCPPDYRVPVKTRYYVDDFPYGRHDDELPPEAWGGRLADDVLNLPRFDPDVLILSDYHKGFFHEGNHPELWVGRCRTTIVDPKRSPIDPWRGCTVFKPNEGEARALSGKDGWRDQADFFLRELRCRHVVITRGGNGVVGKSDDGSSFEYLPPGSRPPRSVIGAGDCFVAFLAMALGLDFPLDECARVAFQAGATYVRQIHNQPITPHALLAGYDPVAAKGLVPCKPRDFRLVFTNGCFDLLHAGHLSTLRWARAQGDRLVVAVNSDESVARLKGHDRPIIPLEQRMTLLAGLDCVDYVCRFDEDTPEALIAGLDPEVVVKGGDYARDAVVGGEGRVVALAPYLPGLSTTGLLERLSGRRT